MAGISIEDRIQHRIRAGMVNPRTMALEITRDEAKELVQSIYKSVNSQYIDAMREEYGENEGLAAIYGKEVLDNLHDLRMALKTGEYDYIIEGVDANTFGVPLRLKEEKIDDRSRISGQNAVDTAEKWRYSGN